MSVVYATANGTATAGLDYTSIEPTTITFAPGETYQTVQVAVTNDLLDEPDNETFLVNLSNPENATLAGAQATGTIYDDDYAPIAYADGTYTVARNQTLGISASGVLANDSPGSGGSHVAVLVSGPSHGALSLGSDGGFSYTPSLGYVGGDAFTYRVFDGANYSDAAAVSLDVYNTAPYGDVDAFSTFVDTPITIGAPGVLGNDSDPNGDPLTAVVVSAPGQGTLVLNSDGSFTYTPAPGVAYMDYFSYRAFDGIDYSEPIGVMLYVQVEYLTFAGPERIAAPGEFAAPTNEQLGSLVQVAIAQWFVAGTPAEALREALTGVEVRVVDLPDNRLAAFVGGVILIDTDAAGYGWYIDSTPWSSEEFGTRVARSERQALLGSEAFGHVDLLTVLSHEIGHALGRDDLTSKRAAHHIMNETLGLGTRRYPAPSEGMDWNQSTADRAREILFAQLAMDSAAFTQSGRIRFLSPRTTGSRDWLAGADEFFDFRSE